MVKIQVRNVPDDVALKLNEMAASKGLSREAFLRNYFLTLTTKK